MIYSALALSLIAIVYYYMHIGNINPDDILNQQLNYTYDYIIVGAGSAGAIIATRLTEDPKVSVLLLEAGGSEMKNNNILKPELVGSLMFSDVDWEFYTVTQKYSQKAMKDQSAYWPSGRVLGGSSSINFMCYARGSRHDFDQWASEGCKSWSYEEVLPYFKKIEDVQIPELSKSLFRGIGGKIPITDSRHQNPVGLFTKAADELGWKPIDYNGKDVSGFSYVQYNVKNGERYSSAKAYLRPVIYRQNLHIHVNALASKIVMNGKRATGIEFIKDNRKGTVYARKEIIISAGAVNSPVLLMLSGIGPRQHLDKLNSKGLYNYTDREGQKTCKVATVQYTGHVDDKNWNSKSPDFQIVAFAAPGDKGLIDSRMPFNIRLEINEELFSMKDKEKEFTFLNVLLNPKSRGTVRLKSVDPFDNPLIDPNFLHHSDDVKILIQAIRQSQKIASTNTLQKIGATVKDRLIKGVCDKEVFDSDPYWECHIRHFGLTMWHPSSTCRMGTHDDKTAVVDQDLRVRGVHGLRVADCSVLRNIPSGNTNAPCMMVGEKAADMIRGLLP